MAKRGAAGTEHLYKRGRVYWCWFYDQDGKLRRESTGATDKTAARARLSAWERAAADPDSREAQTLNDCLQALLDDRRTSTRAVNIGFLTSKVKALVTVLGHDRLISSFKSSAVSWSYVDLRRKMRGRGKAVSDRTIKRELSVLRSALALAKSRGRWSGDLGLIIPPEFKPPPAPKGDALTRDQASRILRHLSPDSAAAAAFCLATGAELSGLRNALRSDLDADFATCRTVTVRGTKNEHRFADVPIVTDEQRLLLAYARLHARGTGDRLFGGLHRLIKELRTACLAEAITVVSPHDLRRSAGQWMVDLAVPIELVSKFMRHANTAITESVYAKVKRETLPDRMLDAIDPRYARQANAGRRKPVVATLSSLPPPRHTVTLYEVDGVSKTLSDWAVEFGVAKTTLHGRVVTRGLSMKAALALGKPRYRARRAVATGAPPGRAPDGPRAPRANSPPPPAPPSSPPSIRDRGARLDLADGTGRL